MNLLALAAFAALEACPYFAEILPDPQTVEDSRGEFVEIRLPYSLSQDSLSILNEKQKIWNGVLSDSVKRILLIRDTSLCPRAKGLLCDKLTGAALPNSRESVWSLWTGTCADSAKLPVPKAGKSFVRNGEAFGTWEYASPTPGIPNAFEKGVQDCRLEIENLTYSAKGWSGKWKLSGCDSAFISTHFSSLFSLADESWNGSLWRDRPQFFEVPLHAEAFHLQVQWPEDDVPGNDGLDSLFADAGSLPVRLTEVHPCPDEGIPEWFEIYNGGVREISLSQWNLCKEKTTFPAGSSIRKHESVVLTKDTAAMRNYVGNEEVKILLVNFGYLKNAADSLFLCYGDSKIDSVFWGKSVRIKAQCPAGFSVASGRKEDSPGFQTPGSFSADTSLPFQVNWNARIFSKKNRDNPLMVSVQSEVPVTVELISGKGDLLWKKEWPADESGNGWREVPLLQKGFPGANFLRISSGRFEKRIGIILRP
ncbi:lamin tail domain-containing protein [Fibrobacter intestinalis]|uniref:lamin tail domain-containing protein n=1 Tax=Fibrobacter intestinalis TaxID=28122 RepID=UPI0023F4EC43|nr:lamin tail domain-containing protein [Fibrobacter intestinalis]MDD7298787.1 lamin tail domain-containing protein [Fibrobacter intestinalis]